MAKVYRDLLKYKLSYAKNKAKEADPKTEQTEEDEEDDMVDLKLGIIGCGQVGTMLLTKFLEVVPHFQGLKVFVSTRQPHLLKEFKQEFEIEVDFDNEKIARKCDLIFLCCLPFQADIVLREVRSIISERNYLASRDKSLNKPVIISTLAAVGIPKLKILATEDSILFRTVVSVAQVKEEIENSQSRKRLQIEPEESKQDLDKASESESEDDNKSPKRLLEITNEETKTNELQRVKFLGNEPYFMISQASENLIKNLDDLFNIFDNFQNAFYSGEAQVAMKDQKQGIEEDKAVYEESILITILGESYMDFIDSETGEWVNEKDILAHFAKLFNEEIENLLRNSKNTN